MQRRYKMNIRPIRNEIDYDGTLDRVDFLMDLDPDIGTKESDELGLYLNQTQ
jgi:antitoxin component HigA of HigAB toxin-antitoxin module